MLAYLLEASIVSTERTAWRFVFLSGSGFCLSVGYSESRRIDGKIRDECTSNAVKPLNLKGFFVFLLAFR